MSKRGGTSEVNGFISIGSDGKHVKKKEGSVAKKDSEENARRKPDSNKDQTQSRTRLSNVTGRKESSYSQRNTYEKKETKPKINPGKSESSLSKIVDRKESNKKESLSSSTVKNTNRTSLTGDKNKTSTRQVHKSYSEVTTKAKELASSSRTPSRGTKPKSVQSTPEVKKYQSLQKSVSITGQSKDSPYKSSFAQKSKSQTNSFASGDRPKGSSQLKEIPLKAKTSSSHASTLRTNKQSEGGFLAKRKSSSSQIVKSHKDNFKTIEKVLEESDSEVQQQSRPFGEIPRSNTFTKEGGAPDSLTSNLSANQSQATSLDYVSPEDDTYQYEEDFEDYESDFEEYMESNASSSSTPEEDDDLSSEDSNDDSTSLDEDELGDGYRGSLTSVLDSNNSALCTVIESKVENNSTGQNSSTKKSNVYEKDKAPTVEEERKLDSGSYDLTSHSDLKRKKQIQDIRAAIDKENASFSASMRSKKSFLEDEGFVEVFNQETPTLLDISYSPTEGLINFENARKQQISKKAKAKVRKRGAVLMEMIKLDVMSFSLLDIPSVPYEIYMQCYGRSNTLQIHTQTNEDAICEEVQTEYICTLNKWTQHPIKYSSPKSSEDLLSTFTREKLGVGGESTVDEKEDWFPKLHVNSMRLHDFINNAGEMILTLLEEDERDQQIKCSTANRKDFGFSGSYFSLNVEKVEFLKKRHISLVCFSESNSSFLLIVHKPSTEPLTIQAESEGRCVLSIWSIREPSCPLQVLVASNEVSSVSYHSFLVLAGLIDGALCLWDLREQSVAHARCYLRDPEWLLRSPTYITADLEKGQRHSSSVVSIKFLPEINSDDSAKSVTDKTPSQVVSLDEDGLLAIWTIVETKAIVNINTGLAPWGKIRIVQSSQLKVLKAFPKSEQSAVQCRCLVVDSLKPSNLYIGTNTGQIIHTLQTSCRARPQLYSSQSGANTSITCMEFSRCGYPLLMVGDSAGRIQIYRTLTERPLLDLSASDITPGPPIVCLQWSPSQPGLFFVLDSNSCIHVWDLCSSDMCPQMSVPFVTNNLSSFSLAPHLNSKMLAVASEMGSVDIYNLKDEFGVLHKEANEEKHNLFSRYITIL